MVLQDYTDLANISGMPMRRLPIAAASRLGVSKLAAQSMDAPLALTRHGNVVAVVGSAARIDEDARLMRESATAVIDAAADLVSSRGQKLSLNDVCARLNIDVDRVRTRAAELQSH